VLAISSPSLADGVQLGRLAKRRLAFYSSNDDVIASRTADWPTLASFACDFESKALTRIHKKAAALLN
jgi:hypothetical protein